MQCTGCFTNGGSGCQDVVDDNAGPPCNLRPGAGFDPHGSPDALRAGSPAKAFLPRRSFMAPGSQVPAGQQRAGPRDFAEDIRDLDAWKPAHRPFQQQVDRAEAPVDVGRCTGGHGDQQEAVGTRCCCPDCPGQRVAQSSPKLMLAVPFERQQALRQLVPVHPRCHDRKQDGPRNVHECWGSAFRPERMPGQLPETAGAGRTKSPVLRPAADTVHRDRQSEEITRGAGQPINKAQDGGRVFSPVQRGRGWGRLKVRIRSPGLLPTGTSVAVSAR